MRGGEVGEVRRLELEDVWGVELEEVRENVGWGSKEWESS